MDGSTGRPAACRRRAHAAMRETRHAAVQPRVTTRRNEASTAFRRRRRGAQAASERKQEASRSVWERRLARGQGAKLSFGWIRPGARAADLADVIAVSARPSDALRQLPLDFLFHVRARGRAFFVLPSLCRAPDLRYTAEPLDLAPCRRQPPWALLRLSWENAANSSCSSVSSSVAN
jgi:hypothetical protein